MLRRCVVCGALGISIGGIDGGVAWLAVVVTLRALFLGLWVWYEGVVNRKEYIYYAGVRTEYC